MVVGDKWEMYIPSDLGYGETGKPPGIGSGDVLVFTMEILAIKGGTTPLTTCKVKSLAGCDAREKSYVEWFRGKSTEERQTEFERLKSIRVMRPQASWLRVRINILRNLVKAE